MAGFAPGAGGGGGGGSGLSNLLKLFGAPINNSKPALEKIFADYLARNTPIDPGTGLHQGVVDWLWTLPSPEGVDRYSQVEYKGSSGLPFWIQNRLQDVDVSQLPVNTNIDVWKNLLLPILSAPWGSNTRDLARPGSLDTVPATSQVPQGPGETTPTQEPPQRPDEPSPHGFEIPWGPILGGAGAGAATGIIIGINSDGSPVYLPDSGQPTFSTDVTAPPDPFYTAPPPIIYEPPNVFPPPREVPPPLPYDPITGLPGPDPANPVFSTTVTDVTNLPPPFVMENPNVVIPPSPLPTGPNYPVPPALPPPVQGWPGIPPTPTPSPIPGTLPEPVYPPVTAPAPTPTPEVPTPTIPPGAAGIPNVPLGGGGGLNIPPGYPNLPGGQPIQSLFGLPVFGQRPIPTLAQILQGGSF